MRSPRGTPPPRTATLLAAALLAATLLAASLCGGPAAARTWHLNPDGTGDAATVRAAAAAAANGDTLLLTAGVFSNDGTITVDRKTLLIKGAGQDQTILEGAAHGNIVYLQGPGNDTELRYLTIRGGHADVQNDSLGIGSDGGGIHAEEAYFTLHHVRITECTAGAGGGLGGAIFMTSVQRVRPGAPGRVTADRLAAPGAGVRRPRTGAGRGATPTRPASLAAAGYIHIDGCRFDHCFAGSEGGAISAENAVFVIENSVFEENDAVDGGGLRIFDSFGNVVNCLFLNNHAEFYGGGLKLEQSLDVAVHVADNTFYGNRAERGGAGCVLMRCQNSYLENNIFARQGGAAGDAYICQLPGTPTIGCNVVFENASGELLNCDSDPTLLVTDPLFCSAPTGDFRLCADSPAAASRGNCGPAGAYGVGCAGAGCSVAVQSTHWGTIKSLYRP